MGSLTVLFGYDKFHPLQTFRLTKGRARWFF